MLGIKSAPGITTDPQVAICKFYKMHLETRNQLEGRGSDLAVQHRRLEEDLIGPISPPLIYEAAGRSTGIAASFGILML